MADNSVRTDYCSWCFERTRHEPRDRSLARRRIYECMTCSRPTLVCTARGCSAMARDEGKIPDLFCAAHSGAIAGFSNLTKRIPLIDDYESLFAREVLNLGRVTKVGVAGIGGAALLGPAAFIAAPAVGGAIGTTVFGLSGAAAISKGLATLGLGSMAAGGFGMAGGITVISAAGAAAGTALGGVVADAYYGDIADFKIIRLKSGKGPAVIVVNGFLTQKKGNLEREWLDALGRCYPRNPWYLVEWETKRLIELGTLAGDLSGSRGFVTVLKGASRRATKSAGPALIPVEAVLATLKIARNPWTVATVKAAMTGSLLAEILSRTPGQRKYILMGHSLGARVIYYALQSLGHGSIQRIKDAHLGGGAVGIGEPADWDHAASAVYGGIHNYYSTNDEVLRLAYQFGMAFMGSPPIGRNPIKATVDNIFNHDVSEWVGGHNEYKRKAVQYSDCGRVASRVPREPRSQSEQAAVTEQEEE